jgi:hypothetical protein
MLRLSVCLVLALSLAAVVGCDGPAPQPPPYQPVAPDLGGSPGSPNSLDSPLQGPLNLPPPPPPEVLNPPPPIAQPVQIAPEPAQLAPVGP